MVPLDDFPVCNNTDVELHRTKPSAWPEPATESGVQSRNCLVTSQILNNTGVYFLWHSSQLPEYGWIWWPVPGVVLKMPLMWSYILGSYRLCYVCEITNLPAASLHANGCVVWSDCGKKVQPGMFAILHLGKWSKLFCTVDQLKPDPQVQTPKCLHASLPSHTPSLQCASHFPRWMGQHRNCLIYIST